MKNTITDLNNHLFEQLERLNDEEITGKELEQEIKRAEGIVKVSNQIIMNAELAYKVSVLKTPNVPEMLEIRR